MSSQQPLPNAADIRAAREEADTVEYVVAATLRDIERVVDSWLDPLREPWGRVTVSRPDAVAPVLTKLREAGYAAAVAHWHGTVERPAVQFALEQRHLQHPQHRKGGDAMSMPDPQPMDPTLLDELQDDIKERRCGVAYGMALALQDLSSAHDYWQARAEELEEQAKRLEFERDAARKDICCIEVASRGECPHDEDLMRAEAEEHGWGYLYPESGGDSQTSGAQCGLCGAAMDVPFDERAAYMCNACAALNGFAPEDG